MDQSTHSRVMPTHCQPPGTNPFLPFGTYIPDGEPKVFGDRVYLYGSYDLFNGGYCSKTYHVFSAPSAELTRWTDHGISFTVDAVPWSDALLYAPDALFFRGKYYLFFCLSDGTEGVAESERPVGPFENARRITLNGEPITGIDPSVWEEGGRVYYTWGQFHLNAGELNDDLCSLKPESVHTDVLSNAPGREGFHEGSSLRRLGDKYCIVYASEYTDSYPNSGSAPTKLDYALSEAPYGPYRRQGTIVDNQGCDPSSWNNHGSVIRIGEEWFVFYHASSNNSAFSRRARAERIEVDEAAGVICQARPTTNGFVKTLLPEHIASPVQADRFWGGAYVTQTADVLFPCDGLVHGAGFSFSPVLFEKGDYTVAVCYRAFHDVRIRISLGETPMVDASLPASHEWRDISFCCTVKRQTAPIFVQAEDAEEAYRFEILFLCIGKQ